MNLFGALGGAGADPYQFRKIDQGNEAVDQLAEEAATARRDSLKKATTQARPINLARCRTEMTNPPGQRSFSKDDQLLI